MTVNDMIEAGVVIQGLGRVTSYEGDDEITLFEGTSYELYAPVARKWADREIRYIYPLPGCDGCPIITIEVE